MMVCSTLSAKIPAFYLSQFSDRTNELRRGAVSISFCTEPFVAVQSHTMDVGFAQSGHCREETSVPSSIATRYAPM